MKWAAMLLAILAPLLTGIGILWKKLDKIWQSINRMDRKKVSQKQCEKRRAQCCVASKKKKGYYMRQSLILIAALAGVFFLAGCANHKRITITKVGDVIDITAPSDANYEICVQYR